MGQEQAVSCSFSSMGHHGRLGNQIFQYALIKSISLAKGHEIFLPDSHDLGKYFVSEKLIGKAHSRRAPLKSRHYVETDPYHLDPEVFNISEDTDFHGYFQNMGRWFSQSWCSHCYTPLPLVLFSKSIKASIFVDARPNFCSRSDWRHVYSTGKFSES